MENSFNFEVSIKADCLKISINTLSALSSYLHELNISNVIRFINKSKYFDVKDGSSLFFVVAFKCQTFCLSSS